MCKKISDVAVENGPCGFVCINFGFGKFHLPQHMAIKLMEGLLSTLATENPNCNEEEPAEEASEAA